MGARVDRNTHIKTGEPEGDGALMAVDTISQETGHQKLTLPWPEAAPGRDGITPAFRTVAEPRAGITAA